MRDQSPVAIFLRQRARDTGRRICRIHAVFPVLAEGQRASSSRGRRGWRNPMTSVDLQVARAGRVPWHEFVTVRGLRHRLTRWGGRSSTPVILLHGWMDTGETFQFLVDHLPESWSCVAPDWRGFGESEWPAEGYWFADYFADLEALLGLLSPDQPARSIAHSMGGNVATMYAGIRPKRLRWV